MIVLLVAIFLATFFFVDYKAIISEIFQMVQGNLPERATFTMTQILEDFVGLITIDFILTFTCIVVMALFFKLPTTFNGILVKRGGVFGIISFIVFLEEIVFRILLFGLPLTLSSRNIYVFYFFWIVSNVTWGVLHIPNYKKEERHFGLILPQIISGMFILSFVYLKYGFWTCFMIHLVWDYILFSVYSEEELKSPLFKKLPSRLLGIGIGYWLLGGFSNPAISQLLSNMSAEGFTLWQFVGLLLLFDSLINIFCDLAGMDEVSSWKRILGEESGFWKALFLGPMINFGFAFPALGLLLLIYYLVLWIVVPIVGLFSKFTNPAMMSAFFCALIFSFGRNKEDTPSSEFRRFITEFPIAILVFIFFFSHSWMALLMLLIVQGVLGAAIDSIGYLFEAE